MSDSERDARDAYRVARALEVVAIIAADTAAAAYAALRPSSGDQARIAAYATMLVAGAERAARHADVQAALGRIAAIRASTGSRPEPAHG